MNPCQVGWSPLGHVPDRLIASLLPTRLRPVSRLRLCSFCAPVLGEVSRTTISERGPWRLLNWFQSAATRLKPSRQTRATTPWGRSLLLPGPERQGRGLSFSQPCFPGWLGPGASLLCIPPYCRWRGRYLRRNYHLHEAFFFLPEYPCEE